ncbi:MAG: helix-turn-helix domain-containing protein [Chloroflexi bacterium]|nr:helix-turn-helix domain-containing protein [Chloroflexota bacterium]
MSVGQQLHYLIQWAREHWHRAYSYSEIADAAGITSQGLTNILDGSTPHPRLTTIRNICGLFEVSLDYFDCQDESKCEDYLAQWSIEIGGDTLHQINLESMRLSPLAQDNVLQVLHWLELSQGS